MSNPTTANGTPPASARIGQPIKPSSVVLRGYPDNGFPGIAFVGELAIDLDTKTLAYYDSNGAWQGVLGGADYQSFYGPVAPTTGVNEGDRWFSTVTQTWSTWSGALSAWLPGDAAYSKTTPTSPTVGQAWYNPTTKQLEFWDGTSWVLGGTSTAPQSFTGALPSAAHAGSRWTDSSGVQWICITAYTSGGTLANWQRVVLANDPLATLIRGNGNSIICREATSSPPTPTNPGGTAVTSGLIWLDLQKGSDNLGNFFVYDPSGGGSWKQVYAPATLELCLALLAGRHYRDSNDTDTTDATADNATVVWSLSNSPIAGSGNWFKNGLSLRPSEYTLSGRTLIVPPSAGVTIKSGDHFTGQYDYNPALTVPNPAIFLVGVTNASANLTSLPLPSGVQAGDLWVLCSAAIGTCVLGGDSRIVHADSFNGGFGSPDELFAWGYLDSSTTDLPLVVSGPFNATETCLCVYRGVVVNTYDAQYSNTGYLNAHQYSSAYATLAMGMGFNDIIAGTGGSFASPYVNDAGTANPYKSVSAVAHWSSTTPATSPSSTFTFNGGFNWTRVYTLKLDTA